MEPVYVGMDTSNYTTSICAIEHTGAIFYEDRRLLQVPKGKNGLKQSEAMFQHLTRLPDCMETLRVALQGRSIKAVGVSTKPRPFQNSYMPVFLPGVLAAHALAAGANVSVYETTHQEGHIAAAEATSGFTARLGDPFLAFHLSGGTTDLLWVKKTISGYVVRELYSSLDLHVGQFIDRIGVALGMPFPAGKELEKIALNAADEIPAISSAVIQGRPSFSGPLTAAQKLLEHGVPADLIAAAVLRVVSASIEKSVRYAMDQTGLSRVLFVGGVASNEIVRKRLKKRFGEEEQQKRLYFCDPEYSSDNALGVAEMVRNRQNL